MYVCITGTVIPGRTRRAVPVRVAGVATPEFAPAGCVTGAVGVLTRGARARTDATNQHAEDGARERHFRRRF